MEDDEMIEQARKKWEEIIADKKIRDRALRREVAELDRNTALKQATDEGFQRGMEEGIEQGQKEKKLKLQ